MLHRPDSGCVSFPEPGGHRVCDGAAIPDEPEWEPDRYRVSPADSCRYPDSVMRSTFQFGTVQPGFRHIDDPCSGRTDLWRIETVPEPFSVPHPPVKNSELLVKQCGLAYDAKLVGKLFLHASVFFGYVSDRLRMIRPRSASLSIACHRRVWRNRSAHPSKCERIRRTPQFSRNPAQNFLSPIWKSFPAG